MGKVIDREKVALDGANVVVVGTDMKTSTDLDGSYILQNVPEGTYMLKVSDIGYNDTTKTGVRVIRGQTVTQDFILNIRILPIMTLISPQMAKNMKRGQPSEKETGKIIVKVWDAKAREGIVGANVTLVGTKYSAVSDMNGYYNIEQVPSGTYVLSVEMLGYKKTEMIEVTVVKDKTTVKTFNLEPIFTHPPY